MNEKQVQCLLTFLGYDCGGIDGIFGPKTRAAMQAFQSAWALARTEKPDVHTQTALIQAVAVWKTPPAEVADPWEGIQYFTPAELRCKCGGQFCGGFPAAPERRLLLLADRVRGHFGAPVTVSSGVRCETHNRNVGGVENSRHLKGKAMDFRVAGQKAEDVLEYVKAQKEVRYAYDIDGTYVHMDVQ